LIKSENSSSGNIRKEMPRGGCLEGVVGKALEAGVGAIEEAEVDEEAEAVIGVDGVMEEDGAMEEDGDGVEFWIAWLW